MIITFYYVPNYTQINGSLKSTNKSQFSHNIFYKKAYVFISYIIHIRTNKDMFP